MTTLPQMVLSEKAVDFIDDAQLHDILARNASPDSFHIHDIIQKSLSKEPLSVEETAVLLNANKQDLVEQVKEGAYQLKNAVYGNRIVLFAPLYVGNECINDCHYCGFRRSNTEQVRRTLSEEELVHQVTALEQSGHKRLILVFGEHPQYDAHFIADTVRAVYGVTSEPGGEIRRVNINAAPLDVEGYRVVKEAGIGTYQIFQETYHHETYRAYHPENTRKGNYLWRLDGLNRAFEGGCDDVGLGVLYGLYDWKFETLAMVRHAIYLKERFNVGPHTLSFPRIQSACGVDITNKYLVSDADFMKLIAVLRLAVPYTGLILTAREKPEIRREGLRMGVSQIDAGSRIEIGGYTETGDAQVMEREQFSLGDIRSLDTVMRELMQDGYVPSFCTSCYRLGRTGEHFMEFSVPGFIKRFCTPNALLTLQEYLMDYASAETRVIGEGLIMHELQKMPQGDERTKLEERLRQVRDAHQRDLYY